MNLGVAESIVGPALESALVAVENRRENVTRGVSGGGGFAV